MTELMDYTDQDVIIRAIPGIALRFNSNEYVDHLAGRIKTCEETIKNYEVAIRRAQYYSQKSNLTNQQNQTITHCLALKNLKAFIEEAMSKRNEDLNNNIGRHCSIPGDTVSRQWTVVFAMERDSRGWPQYLVRNVHDLDSFKVVSMIHMTNLY